MNAICFNGTLLRGHFLPADRSGTGLDCRRCIYLHTHTPTRLRRNKWRAGTRARVVTYVARLITLSSYPYVNVETVALGWFPWDGHTVRRVVKSISQSFLAKRPRIRVISPHASLLLFIPLTTIARATITDRDSTCLLYAVSLLFFQ